MPIKWINESWAQRRETLAIGFLAYWIYFGELTFLILTTYIMLCGSWIWRTLMIIYLIYIIKIDRETARKYGGRRQGSDFIRNMYFWKVLCRYYPATLVKTVDLPPNKNYILAAFPHGILSLGAFTAFCTNALGFNDKYPKIRSKLSTFGYHFNIPFFRELLMWWGMSNVNAESINYLLNASNDPNHSYNDDGYQSNAVVIMVGGAQEAFNSKPNCYKIILKNRKGFVKIALRTGSDIVPVITYGEVNIYEVPTITPNSKTHKFQIFFKKLTGIAPAFYLGRGVFQMNWGVIPFRHPMVTVVGAPIAVTKNENPTQDEIDHYHAIFTEKLNELFETHKSKYLRNHENIKLVIE